jgi:hypothetical protein
MKHRTMTLAMLLAFGLIQGCASTNPSLATNVTTEEPCCGTSQCAVAQTSDCAKAMVVIRQTDSCQRCNEYPIAIRASGSCVRN